MEVRIHDSDYNFIGVMDFFRSMIWTDRFNVCGDFEIYTTMSDGLLSKVKEDYVLEIEDSDRRMIVEDIKIETDEIDGDMIKITGRSLESILNRRIIWGQKTLDGSLQNGIKTLITDNAISPSDPNRTIPNLIFKDSTDPKITGLTLKAQLMGENLYEYIVEVCKGNDIGFRIMLNGETLEFELYSGVDRSYDQILNPQVIFSPQLDNLNSSDYYKSKKKLKTITFVAGEGEGSNRKTVVAEKMTATGLDRREEYTDASRISQTVNGVVISEADYLDQLEQKGLENIADMDEEEIFDCEVNHNRMYVYGDKYYMGDIVQIVNKYGVESKSRVSEFIISENLEGFKTYPTFTKIK